MKKYCGLPLIFMLSFFLSSCQAIGDIFKTGVGVGIFMVIVVIIIIVFIARAFTKK